MSSVTSSTTQLSRDQLVAFISGEYPKVVAAVALITGDRAGAEDSVQEALASLWQRQDGFRPDNLAAWVTVVATNRSRSAQRRHGAEARAVGRLDRPDPAVDDASARLADADLVAHALERLPEQQRKVAVLHYLGDHAVSDIAAALDLSEGTVKTHLSRARAALSDALNQGADL